MVFCWPDVPSVCIFYTCNTHPSIRYMLMHSQVVLVEKVNVDAIISNMSLDAIFVSMSVCSYQLNLFHNVIHFAYAAGCKIHSTLCVCVCGGGGVGVGGGGGVGVGGVGGGGGGGGVLVTVRPSCMLCPLCDLLPFS